MKEKLCLRLAAAAVVCGAMIAVSASKVGAEDDSAAKTTAEIQLGRRLFVDGRFSTTAGDFVTSCRDCHLSHESPEGLRAFTDFLSRSWQPWRSQEPNRDTLRNAPTLFDTGELPRLHYDGEFSSLEDLVRGTLTGRPMGWLPEEREQASEWIRRIVVGADGQSPDDRYVEELQEVYAADVESLAADQVVALLARAVASYVRTLRSPRNSAYDRFVSLNALDEGPAAGENAQQFAGRQLARVAELESSNQLRLPPGFSADALEGWKRFHSVEGGASQANCVACHVPPTFSDNRFHNIGVSQREYDEVHGVGRFAALPIPDAAAAVRPDERFRSIPSRERPDAADLGYWNFVDLKDAPQRRADESESAFLERMVATFKTPTLRNLAYSQPYFHNGRFGSVRSTLEELQELNRLARAGQVRAVTGEFETSLILQEDLPFLVAFLGTLNDNLGSRFVGQEGGL